MHSCRLLLEQISMHTTSISRSKNNVACGAAGRGLSLGASGRIPPPPVHQSISFGPTALRLWACGRTGGAELLTPLTSLSWSKDIDWPSLFGWKVTPVHHNSLSKSNRDKLKLQFEVGGIGQWVYFFFFSFLFFSSFYLHLAMIFLFVWYHVHPKPGVVVQW